MKAGMLALAASVLSLTAVFVTASLTAVLIAAPADAQTKASDSFDITVLHRVSVGNQTLDPGEYHVEPLTLAGGDAPVLVFRGPNDTQRQIAVQIVPTVENRLQPETRVTYHRAGGHYYFDRIWVKGVAYGYKFALPKQAK